MISQRMSSEASDVTESTFPEKVLTSDLPVLVDFWAPWCGPCRMISPIVEQLALEYQGRARILKVNVDDAPGLAVRYGVNGIPALLFFKGGQLVDTVVGLSSKSVLKAKLDALV